MTGEDRYEAARDVMRQLDIGEGWLAVIEPGIPPALLATLTEGLRAWGRSDLEWHVEGCHPDLVIRQVPEIPDSSTYTGPDAFVDALLDWPPSGTTSASSRGGSSRPTTSTWSWWLCTTGSRRRWTSRWRARSCSSWPTATACSSRGTCSSRWRRR